MLQDVGVALVVLVALAFLGREFFGWGRKPREAATFVPLASLKNKRPDDHCH